VRAKQKRLAFWEDKVKISSHTQDEEKVENTPLKLNRQNKLFQI